MSGRHVMTFAEDLQNMGVTWRAATRINNNNNNNNDKQTCIAPQGRNFRSDSQRWRQCFFVTVRAGTAYRKI